VDDRNNYEGIDFRVNPPQKRDSSPIIRWILTGVAVVSTLLVFVQLSTSYVQRRTISSLNAHDVVQAKTIEQLNSRINDLQSQLGKLETMNGELNREVKNCTQARKSKQAPQNKSIYR
jgi:septal ring factor EnvC (AmiA/AmiB activator)